MLKTRSVTTRRNTTPKTSKATRKAKKLIRKPTIDKQFITSNTNAQFSTVNRRAVSFDAFVPPPAAQEEPRGFDRSGGFDRKPRFGNNNNDDDGNFKRFNNNNDRDFRRGGNDRRNDFREDRGFGGNNNRSGRDGGFRGGRDNAPRGRDFDRSNDRRPRYDNNNNNSFDRRREDRPQFNDRSTSRPPLTESQRKDPFFIQQLPSGRELHQQLVEANEPINKTLFASKKDHLFNIRDPKQNAPPSHWKSLREKTGQAFVNTHLPVPIIGEAIYGTHSVLSAIVHQKRKLNTLYILSSQYNKIKAAARPTSFKDTSPEEADGQKDKNNNNENSDDNQQSEDSDSIDDSFLVDSTSLSPIKSLTSKSKRQKKLSDALDDNDAGINFSSYKPPSDQEDDFYSLDDGDSEDADLFDDEETMAFINALKQQQYETLGRSKYVTPHHKESGREGLMLIYELASSMGIKVTPLRREKLDQLSDNKPHNGVVLDAQKIETISKDQLTATDLTVPILAADNKEVSTIELQDIVIGGGRNKPKEHTPKMAQKQMSKHLSKIKQQSLPTRPAVYLALESIFDPSNLGAIVRSASWFGVDAIILPKNSCPLTPAVSKVSAGALDSVNIIECDNLRQFIETSLENSKFKDAKNVDGEQQQQHQQPNPLFTRTFDKLCVVGLGLNPFKAKSYDLFDVVHREIQTAQQQIQQQQQQNEQQQNTTTTTNIITPKEFAILIVAGNEGFGLSKDIEELCHMLYKIPTFHITTPRIAKLNNIQVPEMLDSLNVSNAVAISLNQIIASHNEVSQQIATLKQQQKEIKNVVVDDEQQKM